VRGDFGHCANSQFLVHAFLLRKAGAMPTLVVGMPENTGKLGIMATQA